MKFRSLVLVAGLAATLAPAASHAEDFCDVPLYLFSNTRIVDTGVDDPRTEEEDSIILGNPSVVSSAIGCTARDEVIGEDPSLAGVYNTDLIYPAANRFSVRLLDNGVDPEIITVATLTYAGEVYELEFTATTDITGEDATYMDTKSIEIDPTTTLEANSAEIHVCIDFGDFDDICFDRTYWTVTGKPLPV